MATEPEACVAPKPLPSIVRRVPTGPENGTTVVIAGTVKIVPLLAAPATVTTTLPVVAPTGTEMAIPVELQLVTVTGKPLRVTTLLPWFDPKFAPLMATLVPATPSAGDTLVITGADETVNGTPLLGVPPMFTVTFPVAAPVGTVTVIPV